MRIHLLVLIFAFTVSHSQAQHGSIRIFAEVPVAFGIGYEGSLSPRLSLTAQAGILTDPNSTIIINLLETLGTSKSITLMIDDAFKFGIVGKLGLNYNFGRNYAGAFGEIIGLHGGDTPSALIETYFGEDLSQYPLKRSRGNTTEPYLTLRSTLYQAGILYGRRFPLRNRHLEIDAEVAISGNITSSSALHSEVRQLDKLSAEVDTELRSIYSQYAFLPSLSVGLAYRFSIN